MVEICWDCYFVHWQLRCLLSINKQKIKHKTLIPISSQIYSGAIFNEVLESTPGVSPFQESFWCLLNPFQEPLIQFQLTLFNCKTFHTSSFIHEMLNSFQTCGSGLDVVKFRSFANGVTILDKRMCIYNWPMINFHSPVRFEMSARPRAKGIIASITCSYVWD